ncbi:MAG: ATP-dependent helicase HrpB [Kiritimatiellae bacterium]|nr:ATP-dependent helicase HrpB [Kiritimatiellia bacterium]
MKLPIYEVEKEIATALESNNRLVIEAPTGSGKSTQVPQMMADAPGSEPSGQIVVLQPRRIAARMLARRVAQERRSVLGEEVGYQVRFERCVGRDTRIRYVTEGVLLRELVSDPQLQAVQAIVFDEFHERHLFGDVTLAMARTLQNGARPDLKIVVMSATLDRRILSDYLTPCQTVSSSGRTYPVEIAYLPRSLDSRKTPIWDAAADELAGHVRAYPEDQGDVLIFMPGVYEINRTLQTLRARPETRGMDLAALHGSLPPQQQDQAVGSTGRRKVVVATNVAETSITIEGVTTVIDSGLVRMASYDARRGMDSLLIENISVASADQRAGRAGRTRPGRCYRLWTRQEHEGRALQHLPEIKRHDLAEIALSLKAYGVHDLMSFPWVEPPEAVSLERALAFLGDIGALDRQGAITGAGRRMLTFPVHPRYARMLLEASQQGCVCEIALIAALLQGRDLFLRNRSNAQEERREEALGSEETSDLLRAMKAWEHARAHDFEVSLCDKLGIHAGSARQAGAVYRQFMEAARSLKLEINPRPAPEEAVRKCLMAGLMDRLARRLDQGSLRCAMVHGGKGELARSSVVRASPLLVVADVAEIERGRHEVNVVLSQATAVEEDWLRELFPDDFVQEESVFWDAAAKRVRRRRMMRFRDLTFEERVDDQADAEQAGRLLAEEILKGHVALNRWNDEVEQWITRVNCLAAWRPDWELPRMDEAARRTILEAFCHGAYSARELKDKPVLPSVKGWLSGAQQALVERCAPVRLELPSGRKARITYDEKNKPTVSVTIQDLYGQERSPLVADGRIPVRFEILAPNRRPVQITEDLDSFWKNQYPAIKQELKRKYHKHEWR